jgi:predicted XRE-type DNA-binding protein
MPASTNSRGQEMSENVYADLGFDDPTLERLKADIALIISDEMVLRSMSQVDAGRLMGLSQSDVSRLIRGRIGSYSLERLMGCVRALGVDVEVTVRRVPA